jgi:nucleoside-diphosphate-sugar epimerase
MAAQFKAASKTAFFGNQLGSVGYAADKLMLAGISAETIASATTAASKAGSGSTKLAAEQLVLGLQRLNKLHACSIRLYSVYGPRERPEKLYTKLIESSNPLETAITDKLLPIELNGFITLDTTQHITHSAEEVGL